MKNTKYIYDYKLTGLPNTPVFNIETSVEISKDLLEKTILDILERKGKSCIYIKTEEFEDRTGMTLKSRYLNELEPVAAHVILPCEMGLSTRVLIEILKEENPQWFGSLYDVERINGQLDLKNVYEGIVS